MEADSFSQKLYSIVSILHLCCHRRFMYDLFSFHTLSPQKSDRCSLIHSKNAAAISNLQKYHEQKENSKQ
jgi:hypothetical protein